MMVHEVLLLVLYVLETSNDFDVGGLNTYNEYNYKDWETLAGNTGDEEKLLLLEHQYVGFWSCIPCYE